MRAGELRDRIVIERRVESEPDAIGETTREWEEYARAWAAVEGMRGREIAALPQEWAEARWRVRTRYVPGVVPGMRVAWQGRTLKVVSVEPSARRDAMELICSEAV